MSNKNAQGLFTMKAIKLKVTYMSASIYSEIKTTQRAAEENGCYLALSLIWPFLLYTCALFMTHILFRKQQTSNKSGQRKKKNNLSAWFSSEFNHTPTCCDVFQPAFTPMEARLDTATLHTPQYLLLMSDSRIYQCCGIIAFISHLKPVQDNSVQNI